MMPLQINATNASSASIYFSTPQTGTAVAANCGLSGSGFVSAQTASYVLPLNQSVLITGSLTVSGSGTFNNIGPANFTGSVFVSGSMNAIGTVHQFTGSVLISSGSFLNVGRALDNTYPFSVTSQFAKTDTTGRGLMFLGSNEAVASNPFGLVVTVTGASNVANRMITIGTTDYGLVNSGMLNIQGALYVTGSNVGIGTTTPSTHANASGLVVAGTSTNRGIIEVWDGSATAGKAVFQNVGGITYIGSLASGSGTGNMALLYGGGNGSAAVGLFITGSTGNVSIGQGNTNPRTRLQVTPTSNAETPTLGTATGAVTFTSSNTNYGIQFNSTSDGTYFIQSQRFDASATAYALGLNPAGGVVYLGPGYGATNHRIDLPVSQGSGVLVVSGYNGSANDTAIFYGAAGANPNGAATALGVTTNNSTGRSISAGGTINASGADYAEYMTKATTDVIAKGDIVGVNSAGKLTNIFADSVSFVVKSTDPSYVGGDIWGNEEALGEKRPSRTTNQTEEEFASILAEFEAKLEAARAKVDRIAFSGQVPCNVTGANVGDYIIPIELENGKIGGQAVTNPTFEQYQKSVGKVWKIMNDGRAWIAVKIG
jgi:hypothetical protein